MRNNTPSAPTRAAIYVRISRDRRGEKLGVGRQEQDCRALAERMGWDVVAVYVDNDISAYSGKVRPQYRAMLQAAKAGQIGALLAWHPDRLYRRAVDLEEIVNIAEANALQIATVTSNDVDLSTPTGRMNARIIGAVAQGEVERTRERTVRAKEQMAAAGKYRGGRRPFGYNKNGLTIRKKEADALRLATTALLAGRSLAGVVRELNDTGSRTSTGHEWDSQSLRPVLLRARNAGLVQSGPVWTRDPQITGKAAWEPIVSEEEWRAVHRLLTDPSRLSRTVTSEPNWLGSGIYVCGRCGATMRVVGVGATPSRPNYKRQHHYRCSETNHLTAHAGHTDDYVREFAAERVRDPRIAQAMSAGETDGLQADRDKRALFVTRLGQTESDYDEGLIDGRRYKARTDKIKTELAEVEGRLAAGMQQAAMLPIFSTVDPGEAFLAAPLDVQRAVLRAVLHVEVVPAARKGIAWSSDRLVLSPIA